MVGLSLARSGRRVKAAKRGGHVLAFATLVAQPGTQAMQIAPDNAGAGFVPIPVAVERGAAFAVTVADDVLAIDQDYPTLAEALDQLATELREAGHVPVLVASGREGHRHLFSRLRDRDDWLALARALGFRGDALRFDNGRIRPPLAPHRLGLPVALLSPADAVEALVALAPRTQARTHRLSRSMYVILREGDTAGRYKSRSEMALGLALAMVNRGWSEAAISRALMNPKNAGGAKVQAIATKGEPAARRYVAQLYRKAAQRVRVSPPTHPGAAEARAAVTRLREQAERHPWLGMGGATDLSVLQAHLTIATTVGSVTYGASAREVAERAGVRRETVSRAHGRLIGQGWLTRIKLGRGKATSTWQLPRLSDLAPLSSGEGGCMGNGARSDTAAERDLFRWGRGAGLATRRVFDALRRLGRAKGKDVAAALGVSTGRVYCHLRRLREDGIAESTAGVWTLVPEVDAAVVRAAALRGTLGAGEWQRARHRQERERWRETLREPRRALRIERVDVAALVKVRTASDARTGTGMVNGIIGMVERVEAKVVRLQPRIELRELQAGRANLPAWLLRTPRAMRLAETVQGHDLVGRILRRGRIRVIDGHLTGITWRLAC